jgi:hypothetical protein
MVTIHLFIFFQFTDRVLSSQRGWIFELFAKGGGGDKRAYPFFGTPAEFQLTGPGFMLGLLGCM